MINAKDACECTHANRNKVMDEVKQHIENVLQAILATTDFSVVVDHAQILDESMQEEVFDYLSGLGFDIEYSTPSRVKFSWLVD